MVRTFCDRCGRVITGASTAEGATVRAENGKGLLLVKLDFCAMCSAWAVEKLLGKTLMSDEREKKQERAMDKLEFDLTHGTLRPKTAGTAKPAGAPEKAPADIGRERLKRTAKKIKEAAAAETPEPHLNVRGSGAAEKKRIFEMLLRYKARTGTGWAARISKAMGGELGPETIRSIITDGAVIGIEYWRGIERAITALETVG